MIEPWFDANLWAWAPGTIGGVLAGIWGAFAGVTARRGKAVTLCWVLYSFLLLASVVCLSCGVIAIMEDQPFGVFFGLLFPGIQIPLILLPLGIFIRRIQYQVEMRRLIAKDL